MVRFILTKIHIKEGVYSRVGVGDSATSYKLQVLRTIEPDEIIKGDELIVMSNIHNFIKTSPVNTLNKVSNNLYTLRTQTSTYHLEIVKDSDNE